MNLLWIADPWDTLDHAKDSTLYLASLAEKKFNAKNFWCIPSDFSVTENSHQIQTLGLVKNYEILTNIKTLPLSHFHSLHWRTDPPVTHHIMLTWDLLLSSKQKIINHPLGLLKWNEKLSAFFYPNWIPKTYLLQRPSDVKNILKNKSKNWVVKNLIEAASRGVKMLSGKTKNLEEELNDLYEISKTPLLVQEYLPEIEKIGETRIFILDGKIVGCLNKKPQSAGIMDFDTNLRAKPKLTLSKPNKTQEARAIKIASDLKTDGIHFATIDFIGNQLLEINVTSSGLIRWYDEQVKEKDRIGPKYWLHCS